MFPHRNIHKFTWTSPDGKTHNKIEYKLIDRRRHSNILDVRSFRAADCDTDHYLVVAKVRERLAVSKRTTQSYMERLKLSKLNETKGKEKYRVEISNRFAALENLDTELDINKSWETIRENIKSSNKESLGYSNLLDPRKQAKLQWLQDPSKINGDNLNNIRRETSRRVRNKRREYLKDKTDDLAKNNKNKNFRDLYRGINDFKRGYQPRNNLVNVENGDLLADSLNN
ncbi:hypothetical protein B7P43_G12640 [Cryptotermes secundus]|uniref:Endonuclease/exonuclease/phosphatase domain-containing protein n=1 Tax=Cryptotermes secundus TaxID=105785 RepID=A0A2J7PNV3_9NEOP|nr:hypothetical protein B7P43_G12640 [Cryptotermes secundus]